MRNTRNLQVTIETGKEHERGGLRAQPIKKQKQAHERTAAHRDDLHPTRRRKLKNFLKNKVWVEKGRNLS